MSKKLTTKEYIDKCCLIHGKRYDYDKVNYISSYVKVEITCRQHGSFWQWPSDHRRGFGCPQCSGKARGNTETYIKKAKKIHGNFYDYSQVTYSSLEDKIVILCPKHGSFELIARHHIYGTAIGCAQCRRSKGEIQTKQWLEDNNIKFVEQKTFKGLGTSRFDFYLLDLNICIEFDGAQHFHLKHQRTRDKEKALQRFLDLQRRDEKKNNFCREQKISLIRINYKQLNNLTQILNNEVLCYTTAK